MSETAAPGPGTHAWHALPAEEVCRHLGTGPSGITDAEADRRFREVGPNRLAPPEPVSWVRILARQFASVVVLLLAAAAGVAILVGDGLEAAAIGVVLALNSLLGFAVELRARQAMAALAAFEVPEARVIRGGRRAVLPAERLVPGDVIELEAGDAVPADARLLEGADLRAVEAALTGESIPVGKRVDAVAAHAALAERRSQVYTGTTVVAGAGRAVVVATGGATELGGIGRLIASVETTRTPLERRLDALGHRLVVLTLAIAATITGVGVLRGEPWGRMIETGIALAIAAVPEGLPAVATIALAVGLTRMARRNALVRRLGAVEALGSTTVVCTDKTGTLTAGLMSVRQLVLPHAELEIEGSGYEPAGRLLRDGAPASVDDDPALARLLEVAALTPTASIDPATREVTGDPTDAALLVLAARGGRARETLVADGEVLRTLPFSGEFLMSASVRGDETFVKGAPDRVIAASTRVMTRGALGPLTAEIRRHMEHHNRAMADAGLRVIALAWRDRATPDLESLDDLVLLGLAGILDPPAAEVAETVALLKHAGIRTVMITGDQGATGAAVARELGVLDGDAHVVEGPVLAATADDALPQLVRTAAVYARTGPADKLRIVEALQEDGEIVAMLGDGVNDAAALRKADVGVAMGERGTDLARETAAIVLRDDRFATIGAAVEEGRVIDDNIRKFAFYLFSCNLAEVGVLLIAGVLGWPLPLLPLQILWLNLVTDTFPALALAMEPAEPGVMSRPPRAPRAALLSRRFVGSLAFYATLITGATLAAWVWGSARGDLDGARTLAFTTLAFAQLFHLGNARRRRPVLSPEAIVANRWALASVAVVVLLQVAAVAWAPLQRVLQTRPLSIQEWGVVAGLSILPAVVGQLVEVVQERRSRTS
jgi:Ca2+-transporting ATPase